MNETRFCGACGQSNSVDARFCGKCGSTLSPMPAQAPAATPSPAAANVHKTLAAASIDPQALAAHVAQIQAAQAHDAAPRTATYEHVPAEPRPLPPAPVAPSALPTNPARGMQTMMGVALDPSTLPSAGIVQAAPAAPAPAPTPAQPKPRVQYATMIDPPREPSSFDPSHQANALPPAPVAPASAPAKAATKTMMGMAAFDPATLAAGAPPAPSPANAQPAAVQPATAQPAAAQPATAQPASAQPAAAQPAIAQPATAQPAAAQPAMSQPLPPTGAHAPLPSAPIASQHVDARSSRPRDQIMKTMLTASLAAPAAQPESAPSTTATAQPESAPSTPATVQPTSAPSTTPEPTPDPPASVAASPTAEPMGHRKAPIKTMLGMALPNLPPAGIAGSEHAPTVNPTGPTEAIPAPVIESAPKTDAAPTEVAPAPSVARKQLGPSNRTMLGVLAPPAAIAAAAAAAEARDAAMAPAAAPTPTAPVAPAPYTSAHAPDVGPTGDMSIAGMPSPRRRTNALLIVVLLLGALLVLGAAGAFLIFGLGGGHEVSVTPTHVEGGEVLRVSVPAIEDGYRARFAGTELPLAGGTADFPLAADTLHVGDNALSIDLVSPSGDVETHQVTLTLNYRVRADLASLGATPPAITIVVEATPGSAVQIDGAPLTLDASGRATHAAPIEGMTPSEDGMIEYVARYAITPPGGAATEGSVTTRVPLTTLSLERPGDDVVTDQSTIDIAGVVPEGARLTIDGAPITVLPGGRFLHQYAMAAVGEFSPRLVASADGLAPRTHVLHIRRVANLAREAASFEYDRTLTYARLGAAPPTFTGQRVMFEGRVYNVESHDGRGVLQMLVRDCPASERCPLWVSYAVTTDIPVESWVRVYGTVEGEQAFSSATGETRTVPSVAATFILPSRP